METYFSQIAGAHVKKQCVLLCTHLLEEQLRGNEIRHVISCQSVAFPIAYFNNYPLSDFFFIKQLKRIESCSLARKLPGDMKSIQT